MPKDVKEAPVNIGSLHNDYFQYFKYLKMEHAVSRYSRVAYSSSMHCDNWQSKMCELREHSLMNSCIISD